MTAKKQPAKAPVRKRVEYPIRRLQLNYGEPLALQELKIDASSAIVTKELSHDSTLDIWQEPWADWRFRIVHYPRNKEEPPVVGYVPHSAVRGYVTSIELEPREYAGELGPDGDMRCTKEKAAA